MRGQGANPMGRVRAPPCHHLTQNPGPARLPNGMGERHILHASEEVPGHPLGFPRSSPMLRTSELCIKRKFNFGESPKGEVRRIPIPRTRVNKGTKKGQSCYAPTPPWLLLGLMFMAEGRDRRSRS